MRNKLAMWCREKAKQLICCVIVLLASPTGNAAVHTELLRTTAQRMVEWTFESQKTYADPFNDVDVDVVINRGGESWRVPTFWRGGSRWTVRFAPPTPGEYTYHLESTDHDNQDLNGHERHITITPYTGTNALLQHGMLRVSANKRYFDQADGTPFYWLGDTWWSGLSSRLSWQGFKTLTADRKAKGFTVVQIVAGLVPTEEVAPSDPGYCNEGGCVWDAAFKQINPKYFDYADRRIQYLVNAGIAPAIVGAWSNQLAQMGVEKLKKHWRYVIARYGAYPVFWIAGGEVFDPPEEVARSYLTAGRGGNIDMAHLGDWTAVARYIRATDPLHHPITVHETAQADDLPLQDESLTDFQLFQPAHSSWSSIDVEISQLDTHYARTGVTKPLVVGEIGYERYGEIHLDDFQRVAYWLAMLNGAAGHTYGASGTVESYTSDKPFNRIKWSLSTWGEDMNLPGSYQIGLGAKLLQQYPWWRFEPHPEWVTPRGTTLFEPRDGVNQFHVAVSEGTGDDAEGGAGPRESEWTRAHGNFRRPYAAGIPGEVRFIYMPYFGLIPHAPPTVLGIEANIRYHAYFWEPSLGVKVDLGTFERQPPGAVIQRDNFETAASASWTDYGAKTERSEGALRTSGAAVAVIDGVNETNVVATVHARRNTNAGLLLRFHDPNNYVAGVYAPSEKALYILDRKNGSNGEPLGRVSVPTIQSAVTLSAQVSGDWAAVSITDGQHTYTSEIVRVGNTSAGAAGIVHFDDNTTQSFGTFELQHCSPPLKNEHLERRLYDARGTYRGYLGGPGLPILTSIGFSSWDDFGRENPTLLDAYKPDRLPYGRDWVLVLERQQ